jgi:hypothetical protein
VPELEFSLDTATGELSLHIQGVAGPACDDVARLVKELAGEPAREEATAEYRLRPRARAHTETRVRPRRS